jgi:hypothetical protein
MTGPVDPAITRWRKRFALEGDPRIDQLCRDCGETFAWTGYAGRCGWCHEAAQSPRLRVLEGGSA